MASWLVTKETPRCRWVPQMALYTWAHGSQFVIDAAIQDVCSHLLFSQSVIHYPIISKLVYILIFSHSSIFLYIRPCVYIFICPPIHPSIHPSFHQPIYPSIYPSAHHHVRHEIQYCGDTERNYPSLPFSVCLVTLM